MLTDSIIFILEFITGIFVFAAITRFWMQAVKAPANNPVAQFSMGLTNFAVKPLRRLIPGYWGQDWSSLIVAWLATFVLAVIVFVLRGLGLIEYPVVFSAIALYAVVRLMLLILYFFVGIVFVGSLLTLLGNGYHPLRPFFDALTRPLISPLQKRLPPIGGVDISPTVALLILLLLIQVLMPRLQAEAILAVRYLSS